MTTVECPFCHVSSDPAKTAGYCEDCGRKLPDSARYTTRDKKVRILRESADDSGTLRPKYPTAEALFTAAVLRLIVGGGFLVVGPVFLREVPTFFLPAVMLVTIGGTAFFGLAALGSYRAPLPAALAALAAFVAAWVVLLVLFPPGWPLALVDVVVLGWLLRTVMVAHGERA